MTQGSAGAHISLETPEDWTELEGVLGTAIAVLAPTDDPKAFRGNLNVVVQVPDRPQSAEEIGGVHAAALAEGLDEARVIDAGTAMIDGRDASRALVTYVLDGEDLTLEQWMVPVVDRTLVLSATCLTADYAALAGDFAEIVASAAIDV